MAGETRPAGRPFRTFFKAVGEALKEANGEQDLKKIAAAVIKANDAGREGTQQSYDRLRKDAAQTRSDFQDLGRQVHTAFGGFAAKAKELSDEVKAQKAAQEAAKASQTKSS